ncbi:hypothetical protein J3R30DRAFT_3439093 [Lentinula aciculospora]|uniref:PHD-type domain-containing protein n=1 Tax=Lentinula aciculospora TaxID=153920 RepID=A0A9W9ALC1_9AGAR|nr:hypothetical protein J3R30DRAFT_3439093 [Lentinula aciculospora]
MSSAVIGDRGTQETSIIQPHTPKKSPAPLPTIGNVDGNVDGSTGASNRPNARDHLRVVSTRYAHLPTPQSPNDFTYYVPGLTNGPESPISHISHSFATSSRFLVEPSAGTSFLDKTSPSNAQHFITPDSSPFATRFDVYNNFNPSTPTRRQLPFSGGIESLITSLTPPVPRKTPSPSPSEPHSSGLSSPFVAKTPRQSSVSPSHFNQIPSSFAPPSDVTTTSVITTPPFSPLLASESNLTPSISTTPPVSAGGELGRIHQEIQHQHDVLESRRPDYLMRAKRSISDVDPGGLIEDENSAERDRVSSVGIMESPMKGRRIKLFQETSEESFEESLMAGGYGRYRTAEWVRQPQPIVVNAGTGAPVNVVAHLEEVQQHTPPPPVTEKEIRKQKRLNAFRSSSSALSRLYPVEIEGKGRVLLDVPTDPNDVDGLPVSKKRLPNKRKRKAEPTAKERRAAAAAAAAEESVEKPNWPDTEFPWRLRTEERTEHAQAEERQRLEWIEKYLDRDTDDEEDGDGSICGGGTHGADAEDDEILPSSIWGVVYEDGDDQPVPYRPGRGKMVPLLGDPDQGTKYKHKRSAYFPSDPADARAALLSKRNVRALSFRSQRSISRRRSIDGSEEDEILCVCHGVDDGRDLVQCDYCKTWYHLDCIGIDDISELGPPEDQWFCYRCESASDSPPSIEAVVSIPDTEPIFAPTDETPRRQADNQFFHPPVPESPTQSWSLSGPHIPKTPTRGFATNSEFGSGFSSSSSHFPSSRHGPVTPRHIVRDVRIISTPGGPFDVFSPDDSRFDPTTTPSRGIKFGIPFTTPNGKNTPSSRALYTPSKPSARSGGVPGSASFGASGFLSSALSERVSGGGGAQIESSPYNVRPLHPGPPYDDSSPIRREGHRIRRIADPPTTASRALFIEESPLARTKGKGRALDFGIGLPEIV